MTEKERDSDDDADPDDKDNLKPWRPDDPPLRTAPPLVGKALLGEEEQERAYAAKYGLPKPTPRPTPPPSPLTPQPTTAPSAAPTYEQGVSAFLSEGLDDAGGGRWGQQP
jgi:hypothetical protein